MIPNHVQSGCLLSKVLDDYDRAAAHLAGLALLVDLAEAGPLAQLLVRVDADQGHLVLRAQGRDQLLVGRLVAALRQDAQHGDALVQDLARLVDSVDEAVSDERLLEHLLQRGVDVHGTIADAGRVGDGSHISGIAKKRKVRLDTLNVFNHSRNSVLNVTDSRRPSHFLALHNAHTVRGQDTRTKFSLNRTYTSISDIVGYLQHWKRE